MNRLMASILEQKTVSHGITGFKNKRFYIVSALYLASFVVFARDPFFMKDGIFVYQQGFVTLFMAFVLAAALNWELMLFGKPSGANFILSLIQILPLALFIARITAAPSGYVYEPSSVSGYAFKGVSVAFNGIFGDMIDSIPLWIRDIFRNWRITLLLLLMMFFLSFRNLNFKTGALACLFAGMIMCAVNTGLSGNFTAGTILLFCGMYIQFCRYDKIAYIENVIIRLAGCGEGMAFNSAVLRTAARLENGEINREEFESASGESGAEAERLLRSMAAKRFIVMRGDSRGIFISAEQTLRMYDGGLAAAAVAPRVGLTLIFAIVWIILPIDLIPDAIPFFGALDDVTVAILSGIVLKNAVVKK